MPKADASWADVDRLVKEQKYEEAAKSAESLLSAAKAKGDEKDWTKALVTVTQLRIGLHGYETAVRRLREEPWPKGPLSRAQLSPPLRTLARHLPAGLLVGDRAAGAGRHEGRGRPEGLDARADPGRGAEGGARGLGDARGAREGAGLGGRARPRREQLPEGDPRDAPRRRQLPARRPAGRHGGLDARSSRTRSGGSTSGRSSRGDASEAAQIDLAAPAVHPLTKIGAVLTDLEAWHAGAGRKGAQLEARLERVRRLSASFTEERERDADPEGPRRPPSGVPVGLLVGDGEGRGGRPPPAREPPEPPGERPPRGRGRARRVPVVRRRPALPLDREGDRSARGPPPGDVRRRAGEAVDRGLAPEPRRRSTSAP